MNEGKTLYSNGYTVPSYCPNCIVIYSACVYNNDASKLWRYNEYISFILNWLKIIMFNPGQPLKYILILSISLINKNKNNLIFHCKNLFCLRRQSLSKSLYMWLAPKSHQHHIYLIYCLYISLMHKLWVFVSQFYFFQIFRNFCNVHGLKIWLYKNHKCQDEKYVPGTRILKA